MCFFCQLKNPSGQLADWYLQRNWIRWYAWFLFSLKKSRGPSIKGLTSRSFALDVGQKLGLPWLKDAPWQGAYKEGFVRDHFLVGSEKSVWQVSFSSLFFSSMWISYGCMDSQHQCFSLLMGPEDVGTLFKNQTLIFIQQNAQITPV